MPVENEGAAHGGGLCTAHLKNQPKPCEPGSRLAGGVMCHSQVRVKKRSARAWNTNARSLRATTLQRRQAAEAAAAAGGGVVQR